MRGRCGSSLRPRGRGVAARAHRNLELRLTETVAPGRCSCRFTGRRQRESGDAERVRPDLTRAQLQAVRRPRGATPMKKLVVIGNGMAGARVVEEILKRAPDRFDIAMFGAEPYGNYNRILLSNVLNGTPVGARNLHEPAGVVSRQRHHAARRRQGHSHRSRTPSRGGHAVEERRAGVQPPTRPPTKARALVEEPYDHVIIATGSRPFVPPMEGFGGPGTFLFRTLDDCARIADYAQELPERRGHRRRAAGT